MKETQLRIQKYKAMLPHARERVIAALMIFVFSIAMLTVSTFSWITLSVAPEVTGVTTTIAANGNLEIALAHDILVQKDENGNPIMDANGKPVPQLDEDGNVVAIPPSASAIGDSNLPITQKNLTWGNIVNLSDASYGLENITLRPATLNRSSLLTQPLYSAKYGVDGRVIELMKDFRYTQYDPQSKEFTSNPYKGIKAISSVKYEEVDIPQDKVMDVLYQTALEEAESNAKTSIDSLSTLNKDKTNYGYMAAVGGLLSSYADGLLTGVGDNVVCDPDDVANFYDLLVFLDEAVMIPLGETLIDIFEVYQINTYGQDYKYNPNYVKFESVDDFCARVDEVLKTMNDERDNKEGLERVYAGDPLNVTPNTLNVDFYKALNTALADNDTFNAIFPFIADITKLRSCIESMKTKGYVTFEDGKTVGSANVTWSNIEPIVDYLVTIDGVLLAGGGKELTISGWMGNLTGNAMAMINVLTNNPNGNAKASVTVQSGLIERIDKMLYQISEAGGFSISSITIKIKADTLKAKMEDKNLGSLTWLLNGYISNGYTYINAKLTTSAPVNTTKCIIRSDIDNARTASGFTEVVRDYVAQDTYGLSVDFWLRTNAPQSYLTLEGEVVYTYTDVKVTIDGTEYQVYEVDLTYPTEVEGEDGTITTEDAVMEAQQIYKKDGVWYFRDNNQEVVPEGSTIKVPANAESDANKLQTREVTGYVGANRIWTEEELATMSELEYRTTQGMGSCYTFYADPGEIGQILDVLKALKVAFVDSNGNLLATASLATEYCFPEYGKYVVPLMLDDNAIDTGEDTEEGDDIRAIMSLEQNTPTLITALVYLDGQLVSNDKVLSSSDIQGQLNIQFGSTYEPQPLEDEELMSEMLKITAKVTDANGKANPEFYFTNTNKSFSTTVELTVDGEAPKTITANFLRKVTSTQGTRQETITFTQSESEPTKWTANATFTAPGEYILRSVYADGIERKLTNVVDTGNAEAVKVTVHGFSVTNFSGDNGLTYEYMTAADYVTENFSVNINVFDEENGTLIPSSVKGVFINENNVAVTINFTETSSGSGNYKGTATFVSDGTYKLENIIVDGLYYSIGSVYTREVRTKLSVAVWLTHDGAKNKPDYCGCGITEDTDDFRKTANGYQLIYGDTSHYFNVTMKIYDSQGNEILGLVGTNLTYTEGATADLEWSAAAEGYVGHIVVDNVGEYKFVSAGVTTNDGEQTITNARNASSIISISRDPAQFSELYSSQEAIVIGNNPAANMTVSLNNAKSAVVYGFFTHRYPNAEETVYLIRGTKLESEDPNSVTTLYQFTLPKEDGYWTLTKVLATNVAYRKADGGIDFFKDDPLAQLFEGTDGSLPLNLSTYADGEDVLEQVEALAHEHYLVIEDELANRNATIKVIAKVHVSFADGQSKDFGKDANGNITAMFMQQHTVSGLSVDIVDFTGSHISGIDNVVLKLIYSNGSDTNGGYTGASHTNAGGIVTVEMTDNGTTYTQSADATIVFAGNYNTVLNYTIGGKSYFVANEQSHEVENPGTYEGELPSNAPKFTVWSNKPTVTVTGVSPTDSIMLYSGTRSDSGEVPYNVNIEGAFNKSTESSATVYIYTKDGSRYNAILPEVTLKLSGMPSSAFTASMVFANQYNSSYKTTYSFTSNDQEKNGSIGGVIQGSYSWGRVTNAKIFPAGIQTVKTIVVNYGGVDYTVTLSNPVTISQPQYPAYVDFSSTASGATLPTTPSRIVGTPQEDGTFTVTLPGSQTWTEAKKDEVTGTFTEKSNVTETYYEIWDDDCDGAMYQQYDKHIIVLEADGTDTSYTRKYTITGWKIGNKTYSPGETITITAGQTAEAVLEIVDSGHTTTEVLVTRTRKYYTTGSDTTGTPTAGYVNVTSDPDNANKDRWTSSNPNTVDVRTSKN